MVDIPDRPAVDPVGNNLDSVTPVPPPIEAAPRFSDVLRAGLTSGVSASLVCWLLYGIGSLFGTEFDVRQGTDDELSHVAWYQVLIVPLFSALVFALIATALRKRRHCRRNTLILGFTLGAVSLLPVVFQPNDVTWPTRLWLLGFHLLTIALVVPQVARVVGDSDPYITAGYRRSGLEAD